MIAVCFTSQLRPAARSTLERQGYKVFHVPENPTTSDDLMYYAREAAQWFPDVVIVDSDMSFDVIAQFMRDEDIPLLIWNGETFEQVQGVTVVMKAWHQGQVDEAPAWHAGATEAERTTMIYEARIKILGKKKAGRVTYGIPRKIAKSRATRQDEE